MLNLTSPLLRSKENRYYMGFYLGQVNAHVASSVKGDFWGRGSGRYQEFTHYCNFNIKTLQSEIHQHESNDWGWMKRSYPRHYNAWQHFEVINNNVKVYFNNKEISKDDPVIKNNMPSTSKGKFYLQRHSIEWRYQGENNSYLNWWHFPARADSNPILNKDYVKGLELYDEPIENGIFTTWHYITHGRGHGNWTANVYQVHTTYIVYESNNL